MNLDELQSVRDRERQIDKLQQLRESFYADAGEFIQQLRTERERAAERADSPFDAPEVNHLTDEINTAEQTVEAIYEKRVGKIVKNASLAAADLPAETDGLTTEEEALFETLVADITANRDRVIDVLSGESPDDTSGESPDDTSGNSAGPGEQRGGPGIDATASDDGVPAADVMGGSSSQPQRTRDDEGGQPRDGQQDAGGEPGPAADPAGSRGAPTGGSHNRVQAGDGPVRKDGGTQAEQAADGAAGQSRVDRRLVRVTEDVDPFVGPDDRDYDVGPTDVVWLPETNAELLVEQDVAESID